MPLTLAEVPGFADVADSALMAEHPVLAALLAKINSNAAFGMCRLEVFVAKYTNGQTVSLPVSAVDGYAYVRAELSYIWGIANTVNPSTGWLTGPDSLWYCAWKVDQTTGLVSTEEWYRRSGSHDQATQTSDGTLIVFTIAQRQKQNLILATPATAYTDVATTGLVTDAAFTQVMAQRLNKNAKFGVVQAEVIYMGEFYGGQTVPQAVSPADGYTYPRAQTILVSSWRWTTLGSSYVQPDKSLGQMGPIKCSINQATGAVLASVAFYIADSFLGAGSLTTYTTYGRVAVFALCTRAPLIDTIPAVANNFAEIPSSTFFPGSTLRASTVLQLDKNIREAAVSPEFFGPTQYHNGNTVPLPTSATDGYTYIRDECFYIFDWNDTTNEVGTNLREPLFLASVSSAGVVSLEVWRLPPGGPWVQGDLTKPTIMVTVIAIRGATHATPAASSSNAPGDAGTAGADNNAADTNPYTITFEEGDGAVPTASQSLLKHVISSYLISVTLPINLTGSVFKCRTAPASSYTITIKKNGASIGSIVFAGAATSATFTFSAAVSFVPGDILELAAPAGTDTIAGIYGTLSGTRS